MGGRGPGGRRGGAAGADPGAGGAGPGEGDDTQSSATLLYDRLFAIPVPVPVASATSPSNRTRLPFSPCQVLLLSRPRSHLQPMTVATPRKIGRLASSHISSK